MNILVNCCKLILNSIIIAGSISAEHGLGFKKAEHISFSKSPEAIAMMKKQKKIFDPNGILNPYKVLPK